MADPPEQDHGASTYRWLEVVRRARLGTTTYTVAVTLADYANPDGTKIYPGLARLAVDCEIHYTTVKRAMRKLRDAGLVEVVRQGNRRRGWADEYRLVLDSSRLSRITGLTDEEYRVTIDDVRDSVAAVQRRRTARNHGARVNRDNPITEHTITESRVPCAPPTSHKHQTNSKQPSIHSDRWRDRGLNSQPDRATDVAAMDGNDLDLAQTNGDQGTDRRKWADIQQRYDAEEISDEDVIDLIGLALGWQLDTIEQRTVEGMLANGSHVKAAAYKVRADRRVP